MQTNEQLLEIFEPTLNELCPGDAFVRLYIEVTRHVNGQRTLQFQVWDSKVEEMLTATSLAELVAERENLNPINRLKQRLLEAENLANALRQKLDTKEQQ